MSTGQGRGSKNDSTAREAWGDAYDAIPKSVFAYVAWHLSNGASVSADAPGAAAARFLEEWRLLVSHGINPPPTRIAAALDPNGTGGQQ